MPTAENLNPPALLTKDHDRNSFDCGVPVLNDYPKKYALQNQKNSAKRFYEKFGEPSPMDAYHLFLRLSDILSSLR